MLPPAICQAVQGCSAPNASGTAACSSGNTSAMAVSFVNPCSAGGERLALQATVELSCSTAVQGGGAGSVNVTDVGVGTKSECASCGKQILWVPGAVVFPPLSLPCSCLLAVHPTKLPAVELLAALLR